MEKWIDPPLNPGKRSYAEYLKEAYGSYESRRLLDPHFQSKIKFQEKMEERRRLKELSDLEDKDKQPEEGGDAPDDKE